jgi:hypothetical protein
MRFVGKRLPRLNEINSEGTPENRNANKNVG